MASSRPQLARRPGAIDLRRTLGPLVIRWIERELVHGPGDVQGQRIELDDERVRFLLRAYAIDEAGRRIVRRAVLSRAKGWAKSEYAAEIACAEALGPVRFAGWDHDERPLGRPVRSPLIRLAATEEGQAGNTYDAAVFMLREGAISRTPGLDVGLTRTFLPDGGKIVPITAKATSKEGGKESFVVFDETHEYVTEELRRLHAVIRRNLGKRKAAEPWSLETSTMYAPGENSVAEASHHYSEAIAAGTLNDPTFLFDHRQGPRDFDFSDDAALREALVDTYGEAAEWMDIERLIAEARDPDTLESDFRRYFLNQPTERTAGKWITDERWRECLSELEIPKKADIVVGIDAAHTRDTTAVTWTWRSPDGRLVQRTKVWSCIEAKPHHVFVPGGRLENDLARDFVRDELCRDFTVRLVLYDRAYFTDQAAELAEAKDLPVVEMHQQKAEMRAAWSDFYDSIHMGTPPELAHDGDTVYAQHVRNCVGVKRDDTWHISKAKHERPIDAVAGGAMSLYGAKRLDELVPTKKPARLARWG